MKTVLRKLPPTCSCKWLCKAEEVTWAAVFCLLPCLSSIKMSFHDWLHLKRPVLKASAVYAAPCVEKVCIFGAVWMKVWFIDRHIDTLCTFCQLMYPLFMLILLCLLASASSFLCAFPPSDLTWGSRDSPVGLADRNSSSLHSAESPCRRKNARRRLPREARSPAPSSRSWRRRRKPRAGCRAWWSGRGRTRRTRSSTRSASGFSPTRRRWSRARRGCCTGCRETRGCKVTICHTTICQTHEDVYSTLMFSLLLSYPNKDNWALIRAQQLAAKEELPLHVCFCLVVPKSELSTLRHYAFLLRGLQEVATVPLWLCVFTK